MNEDLDCIEIVEVPARVKVTVIDDTTEAVIENSRQQVILSSNRGPQGIKGDAGDSGGTEERFEAAETISALKFVGVFDGGLRHIDPTNIDMRNAGIGVSKTSGAVGHMVTVSTDGVLADSSWSWDEKLPIFAGLDGALTQSVPIGVSFVQVVGVPAGPSAMKINVSDSIKGV
jgi:hypothetical protein